MDNYSVGFATAVLKTEGKTLAFDSVFECDSSTKTVWVERSIPIHLEGAVHDAIDDILKKNGFDPEGGW